MKALLVAVNSSFVHTNPAVRSLTAAVRKNCSKAIRAEYAEYTINQHTHDVLRDILSRDPEIVCFSCYIWNIDFVLKMAQDIKKSAPNTKILLGGPEVSFDGPACMEKYPFVDYLFSGEAEDVFPMFMECTAAEKPSGLDNVLYRENGKICGGSSYHIMVDVADLPAPFALEEDIYDANRIYYYESTRGCPFSCEYCLSGAIRGAVREKSVDQVKKEIKRYTRRDVSLVKFTDRTFNANLPRAKQIWNYIINETGDTLFHFEVGLDLLDEEALALLCSAPKGKIQLEAGVQSCNGKTLHTVIRKTNLDSLAKNAARILDAGNIHLHLDLIAGLPYEGMESFGESFNRIYLLFPDALQLGFLKLLPGTPLRKKAAQYGIVFREYPPYEVLRTHDMTPENLLYLKGIEELLNRYYNTGRAKKALRYLVEEHIYKPFALYCDLCDYCMENGFLTRPVSARNQFEVLIGFAEKYLQDRELKEFLRCLQDDYMRAKIKGIMPEKINPSIHNF
ncbi:MAG: DUF4080 domain-containing protein [Christensenella sp.]|nr:DUF4080 domain-containing protein [Christensenella sp.]